MALPHGPTTNQARLSAWQNAPSQMVKATLPRRRDGGPVTANHPAGAPSVAGGKGAVLQSSSDA